MRTDEPFYWIIPRLEDKQLWNTIAITNEEIMGYWDSPEGNTDIHSIPEDFEYNYLTNERIYQPPIVRTAQPFFWVNEHDEFDTGEWLWESGTLTLEELETIFHTKFLTNPEAFPNMTTVEIREIKNKATQFTLSGNGELSGIKYKTTKTVSRTSPQNSFRLSDNGIISNKKTEYRINTEIIYHSENSFRLSDNLSVLSPQPYVLQISLEEFPDNSLKLSELSGVLSSNQYISGKAPKVTKTFKDNPEFKGYTLISGSIPEVVKTVEEINYPTLKLAYMSGGQSEITEKVEVDQLYGFKQRLSGDKTSREKVVVVLENTPTLGRLIELEDIQPYHYYTKDRLQSPVQINKEHVADWKISMEYPQLWDSKVISNKELLEFSTHTSLVYLKPEMFSTLVRFQPPITTINDPIFWSVIKATTPKLWNTLAMTNEEILSYWDENPISTEEYETTYLKDSVFYTLPVQFNRVFERKIDINDDLWLWDSNVISNDGLEDVYERKLNRDNFILKDIVNYEENNNDVKYSTRGISQSPVQITEIN